MSTVVSAKPAKWDSKSYRRIASVAHREGKLVVLFEDDSRVELDADHVLPSGTRGVDWSRLSFSPYEIVMPTNDGEVEIAWSTIRALSDRDYSAHLAAAAEEEAGQIGLRIRELRESRNLSGKEVAARAGITPQSLSRIEHGHHNVVFTTLQRILAAMGYSLKDLAAAPRAPASIASLFKQLGTSGIDRDLVVRRLVPRQARERLEQKPTSEDAQGLAEQIAMVVSRVFGWSVPTILSSEPLLLQMATNQPVRFKVQGRVNELRATAYTVYAHYLALLVLSTVPVLKIRSVPTDPDELRKAILECYGSLTFEHLVRYAWSLGIPVLPLRDPGGFHGACWRSEDRNVIVLKQVTDSQARWLFDLAHELKHVGTDLSDVRPSVIEGEEISPFVDDNEEWEASDFAGRLILFGRAEELAQKCVRVAQGSVERLKTAVQQVATTEHVPTDALANYIAFRLSTQGTNWWGSANNLQVTEPSPWQTARDCLLEHVDLDRLNRHDRGLLLRAMDLPEEA